MSKTFSDKVREEINNFARIYADFQADYDSNRQKVFGFKFTDDPTATIKYRMRDPWRHLFYAPIESIGVKQDETSAEAPRAESALDVGQSRPEGPKKRLERLEKRLEGLEKLFEPIKSQFENVVGGPALEGQSQAAALERLLGRLETLAEDLEKLLEPIKSEIEKLAAGRALDDEQLDSEPLILTEPVFGLFMDRSLSKPVLDTVRRLGLNERRLGGIVTNDWRVTRALDLGLLTVDDLEPLYSLSASRKNALRKRIDRPKVDGSDPFFWRALLEVFCRSFLAETGRPKEWAAERTVSLAFDLVDIDRRFFKDSERSNRKLLKKLRERKRYRSKYWKDGKWNVSLDAINRLMKNIEPKDDILRVLKRVKTAHEAQFFAEVDKRFASRPKNLAELNKILESVDQSDNRSG